MKFWYNSKEAAEWVAVGAWHARRVIQAAAMLKVGRLFRRVALSNTAYLTVDFRGSPSGTVVRIYESASYLGYADGGGFYMWPSDGVWAFTTYRLAETGTSDPYKTVSRSETNKIIVWKETASPDIWHWFRYVGSFSDYIGPSGQSQLPVDIGTYTPSWAPLSVYAQLETYHGRIAASGDRFSAANTDDWTIRPDGSILDIVDVEVDEEGTRSLAVTTYDWLAQTAVSTSNADIGLMSSDGAGGLTYGLSGNNLSVSAVRNCLTHHDAIDFTTYRVGLFTAPITADAFSYTAVDNDGIPPVSPPVDVYQCTQVARYELYERDATTGIASQVLAASATATFLYCAEDEFVDPERKFSAYRVGSEFIYPASATGQTLVDSRQITFLCRRKLTATPPTEYLDVQSAWWKHNFSDPELCTLDDSLEVYIGGTLVSTIELGTSTSKLRQPGLYDPYSIAIKQGPNNNASLAQVLCIPALNENDEAVYFLQYGRFGSNKFYYVQGATKTEIDDTVYYLGDGTPIGNSYDRYGLIAPNRAISGVSKTGVYNWRMNIADTTLDVFSGSVLLASVAVPGGFTVFSSLYMHPSQSSETTMYFYNRNTTTYHKAVVSSNEGEYSVTITVLALNLDFAIKPVHYDWLPAGAA